MPQKEIDIMAQLIVKAIAFPFVLMMTTLERYIDWIGSNRRNLYFHSFFLFSLIIIAFIHFCL